MKHLLPVLAVLALLTGNTLAENNSPPNPSTKAGELVYVDTAFADSLSESEAWAFVKNNSDLSDYLTPKGVRLIKPTLFSRKLAEFPYNQVRVTADVKCALCGGGRDTIHFTFTAEGEDKAEYELTFSMPYGNEDEINRSNAVLSSLSRLGVRMDAALYSSSPTALAKAPALKKLVNANTGPKQKFVHGNLIAVDKSGRTRREDGIKITRGFTASYFPQSEPLVSDFPLFGKGTFWGYAHKHSAFLSSTWRPFTGVLITDAGDVWAGDFEWTDYQKHCLRFFEGQISAPLEYPASVPKVRQVRKQYRGYFYGSLSDGCRPETWNTTPSISAMYGNLMTRSNYVSAQMIKPEQAGSEAQKNLVWSRAYRFQYELPQHPKKKNSFSWADAIFRGDNKNRWMDNPSKTNSRYKNGFAYIFNPGSDTQSYKVGFFDGDKLQFSVNPSGRIGENIACFGDPASKNILIAGSCDSRGLPLVVIRPDEDQIIYWKNLTVRKVFERKANGYYESVSLPALTSRKELTAALAGGSSSDQSAIAATSCSENYKIIQNERELLAKKSQFDFGWHLNWLDDRLNNYWPNNADRIRRGNPSDPGEAPIYDLEEVTSEIHKDANEAEKSGRIFDKAVKKVLGNNYCTPHQKAAARRALAEIGDYKVIVKEMRDYAKQVDNNMRAKVQRFQDNLAAAQSRRRAAEERARFQALIGSIEATGQQIMAERAAQHRQEMSLMALQQQAQQRINSGKQQYLDGTVSSYGRPTQQPRIASSVTNNPCEPGWTYNKEVDGCIRMQTGSSQINIEHPGFIQAGGTTQNYGQSNNGSGSSNSSPQSNNTVLAGSQGGPNSTSQGQGSTTQSRPKQEKFKVLVNDIRKPDGATVGDNFGNRGRVTQSGFFWKRNGSTCNFKMSWYHVVRYESQIPADGTTFHASEAQALSYFNSSIDNYSRFIDLGNFKEYLRTNGCSETAVPGA